MMNEEYVRIIIQMVKRIHKEELLKKVYTYVKTLLDAQED